MWRESPKSSFVFFVVCHLKIMNGLNASSSYYTVALFTPELPRPPILRLSAPLNSGLKLEWAVRQGIAPVRRYEVKLYFVLEAKF